MIEGSPSLGTYQLRGIGRSGFPPGASSMLSTAMASGEGHERRLESMLGN